MKNKIDKSWIAVLVLFVFIFVSGCGKTEEKKKEFPGSAVGTDQIQSAMPASPASSSAPAVAAKQAEEQDIAVNVEGNILKKSVLEKNIKERIDTFKDKIPADKRKEIRENMRKQLVEEFIMRTLLVNEVEKRKIEVGDKEVKIETDKMKASLPPNKKLEEFLKENKISKEDIVLGVKVNKLVKLELGKKIKPTQKEISKFYSDNSDKFIVPENVHLRHILVTINADDNEKVKAEKKEKIENLRKQLLDGADFSEVARKNSDCPSKENGGDLGIIRKGQTVKPFEDAAFSQEKNVIGPVVQTDFGYHIIQVLERNPAKTISLEEAKDKISSYLERQKQTDTFTALLKKLRENAKIILYQN